MNETDRRVIYTKKVLKDSLVVLLREKPIGSISVTELCKLAGVNRGTFYSHYRQPQEVLDSLEKELIAEIEETLKFEEDMAQIHRNVLRVIDENRSVFRVLLGNYGDPECLKSVLELSQQFFDSIWRDQLKYSEEVFRHLHSFIFAGTVQILRDWLMSNDGRTADEMAEIISALHKTMLK